MVDTTPDVPAWMAAQALVIKLKNVLLEEAIELLYKEVEAKRMAISGSFMPLELEKSGEMEQGLFLIRNLMNEKANIIKAMSSEIKVLEAKKQHTSSEIERLESARKFLIAVVQITSLTEYGIVFEQWFNDVSLHVTENDPARIIASSAMGKESHRTIALAFVVTGNLFKKHGIFTKEEKAIMSGALELVEKK